MFVSTAPAMDPGPQTGAVPTGERIPPRRGGEGPSLRLPWWAHGKHVLDVALTLLLFVPALPLLLLSALAVKLTSRGPWLYSQVRLGKDGRPYVIHKIRTMTHNCESLTGPRWSTPGDTRVTPVGRFLRAAHLDELPQLWNVLRGDMSLIGPRPERPEFVPTLERAIPHYRERLRVRPGITGLAQVQVPPDTDLGSVRRKLAYDLYYVRRLSPWLDLRILLCTVCKLFRIPFTVSGRLFGVPGPETVEGEKEDATLFRPVSSQRNAGKSV